MISEATLWVFWQFKNRQKLFENHFFPDVFLKGAQDISTRAFVVFWPGADGSCDQTQGRSEVSCDKTFTQNCIFEIFQQN